MWRRYSKLIGESLVHSALVDVALGGRRSSAKELLIIGSGAMRGEDASNRSAIDEEIVRRASVLGIDVIRAAADALVDPASVVCVQGSDPAGWTALAAGCELIVIGPAPYAGHGATFDIAGPGEVEEVLAAIFERQKRRNARDLTRRLLAVEFLFNSCQASPEALAAAIAESASSRPPKQTPTVSIVINNFNYRPFLGDAIRSALNQDHPAKEVIVVDDGSTDGSTAEIAGFAGIIPVLKSNGGQGSAFNSGLEKASGDIVLFLDSDDRLLPQATSRIVDAWRPGMARLQFGLETINASGRPTGLYVGTRGQPRGVLMGPLLARGVYSFMPTSGNAYSREALLKVFPVPAARWRISADFYLAVATQCCGTVGMLGEVLGQYRVHGKNAHHHALAWAPARGTRHGKVRVEAWRDLTRILAALRPPGEVDLWRLRINRRLLLTVFEDHDIGFWRRTGEALKAIALASTTPGVSGRHRFHHVAFVLGLLASKRRREPKDDIKLLQWPWPDEKTTDLISAGGPSTWPLLDHGTTVEVGAHNRHSGVLGWGWDHLSRDGAHLTGEHASLAFTLPVRPQNWRVDLAFSLEGKTDPIEIDIECNGAFLTRAAVTRSDAVCLYIGHGLLKEALAGGRACCLTLRPVDPAAARRLRLDHLAVRLAPLGAMLPAPRLPAGQRFTFSGEDRAWLSCGWRWPDGEGATFAGSHGQIIFSTEKNGHGGMLSLGLETEDGVPLQKPPDAWINGKRSKVFVAPGGRSISIPVKLGRLFEDGLVGLDLVAPQDMFPSPGKARLRWMRFDALDSEGTLGAPLLNRSYALSNVATHRLLATRSLVLSNSGPAQIDGNDFELRFRAPCETDVRISLGIVALRPDLECIPVAGKVTFGDNIAEVILGRTTTLTIQSSHKAATTGDDLLSIRVESEASLSEFGVSWFSISEVDRERRARVRLAEGRQDAAYLFRSVEDGADWHAPTDGAFWLAAQQGTLVLDCSTLEDASVLELTVLTLPGLDQKLTVSALGQTASTTEGGRETLRIELPDPSPAIVRLAVTTNRLVSLEAIGGTEPGRMIGGAIVELNVIACAADRSALATAAE